jgi:hypothetical protein
MSAYTPAPWTIDNGAIYGTRGLIRPFVASVEDDHNDGETAANARLIASAPALADALRATLRCLQWHVERHGVGMDAKVAADARALLARIEGAP